MMGDRVALCVDGETMRNPELIGLDGESITAQSWLDVYSGGREARRNIAGTTDLAEAWVVSCDDVEPINLAASLKHDKPDLKVCLVSSEVCGSLLSRAHNALIDEVLEQNAFLRRYADVKQRMLDVPITEGRVLSTLPSAAMSSTAVEVVSAPVIGDLDATAVPEELLQARPRLRPLATRISSRAFVLPVVSGSGGAGKSSVSALCAMIAHKGGRKTLLLDCDLQFGDVDTMVGIEDPVRIDEALAQPDQLEREINREGALSILAAPERLEAAEEVAGRLPDLLDWAVETFDVVVANTGAAWAEQHAVLLERSSAALFLVDQRTSSVRACKHALELCARCGIATGPFQFALNRCAKNAPLTSVDVSCALQGAPVFELKDGGRDVEDYLSSGAAAELIEMKNDFSKSLELVMERLLPGGMIEANVREVDEASRPLRRRGRHAERRRRWK